MSLVQLKDVEYRTHEAIVRIYGREFTVPIKHNATRAQQNAQIEKWFKQGNALKTKGGQSRGTGQ